MKLEEKLQEKRTVCCILKPHCKPCNKSPFGAEFLGLVYEKFTDSIFSVSFLCPSLGRPCSVLEGQEQLKEQLKVMFTKRTLN